MFLDQLKTRYLANGGTPTRGCTPLEIAHLADHLGQTFPAAYIEFLTWAGHDAGDLFLDTEEYACTDLADFRADAQHSLRESGSSLMLPDDALVIQRDFPMQFAFIHTSEGDDPPVYHFAWFPAEMEVTFTDTQGSRTHTIQSPAEILPTLTRSHHFSLWLLEYMHGLEAAALNDEE